MTGAYPVNTEPGMACVREKDGWWNVSILLDTKNSSITCPSSRSEIDAKNFVSVHYPNCCNFRSTADFIAEIEWRRSPEFY